MPILTTFLLLVIPFLQARTQDYTSTIYQDNPAFETISLSTLPRKHGIVAQQNKVIRQSYNMSGIPSAECTKEHGESPENFTCPFRPRVDEEFVDGGCSRLSVYPQPEGNLCDYCILQKESCKVGRQGGWRGEPPFVYHNDEYNGYCDETTVPIHTTNVTCIETQGYVHFAPDDQYGPSSYMTISKGTQLTVYPEDSFLFASPRSPHFIVEGIILNFGSMSFPSAEPSEYNSAVSVDGTIFNAGSFSAGSLYIVGEYVSMGGTLDADRIGFSGIIRGHGNILHTPDWSPQWNGQIILENGDLFITKFGTTDLDEYITLVFDFNRNPGFLVIGEGDVNLSIFRLEVRNMPAQKRQVLSFGIRAENGLLYGAFRDIIGVDNMLVEFDESQDVNEWNLFEELYGEASIHSSETQTLDTTTSRDHTLFGTTRDSFSTVSSSSKLQPSLYMLAVYLVILGLFR